jgi:hypothetical protein
MFEQHGEWWDILCNINTGKVTMGTTAQLPINNNTLDTEFMGEINASIVSHYGEDTVRSLFQNYTQHILDMAFDEEEYFDEVTSNLQLEANSQRIDSWKKTNSYTLYDKDRKLRMELSAIQDPKLPRFIKKLKTCKNISDHEMISIYQTFLDNIKTEEQLVEVKLQFIVTLIFLVSFIFT